MEQCPSCQASYEPHPGGEKTFYFSYRPKTPVHSEVAYMKVCRFAKVPGCVNQSPSRITPLSDEAVENIVSNFNA